MCILDVQNIIEVTYFLTVTVFILFIDKFN